jgi:hypothetical protein
MARAKRAMETVANENCMLTDMFGWLVT